MGIIRPYHGNSPYYEEVVQHIHDMVGEGMFTFDQRELASRMNRKPTNAMRRALTLVEANGLIEKFRYYSERGGLCAAYHIISAESKMPLFVEVPF
jgi:predicted transcriptional regulator